MSSLFLHRKRPASALHDSMDIMTAVELVLRKAADCRGLTRGLNEAARTIDKHAALLCVLAEDCNNPDFVKLIKALCADNNVPLILVPSGKNLGEWAGVS